MNWSWIQFILICRIFFLGWMLIGCHKKDEIYGTPSVASNASLLSVVSVTLSGSGSVSIQGGSNNTTCSGDCIMEVAPTTTLTLTPQPASGMAFLGWEGDGCSGLGNCVVLANTDKHIITRFGPGKQLAVTLNHGIYDSRNHLISSPPGIDCFTLPGVTNASSICAAMFPINTAIDLKLSESSPHVIIGWNDPNCTGLGSCRVTMDQDKTIGPTIDEGYRVEVTAVGGQAIYGQITYGLLNGNLSTDNCTTGCFTRGYPPGSIVTLTGATTHSGIVFTGWNGGGCSGAGTCYVTLDSPKSVTATFDRAGPWFAVTIPIPIYGNVKSSPAGIDYGSGAEASWTFFPMGTLLTLTPTPASGHTFSGWSGGGCSGTDPCVLTITQDTNVTANFN